MRIYRTTHTGRIPYKTLYRYTLTNTFPSDNYWFDDNAYTIYEDFTFPKIIKLGDEDKDKEIVINQNTFT